MCGICGYYAFNADGFEDAESLNQMAAMLTHRGPDGQGIAILDNVGLAHRRLKVIDLETGDQPMFNEDRSISVVFNGEIYNFRDLRTELQALGHVFSSASDTEVIVHLYEEYGTQCVDHMRGMFAFALWDSRQRVLFIARDRAGKKPLYYCRHKGVFWFASEMKALLAVEGIPRKLRTQSVHEYLMYQCVPPPNTMFEGISKLSHGHYLTVTPEATEARQYWRLNYEPKLNVSEPEAVERCEQLIDESVRLRLESDVPLGVFLSGGVDSSLIVAMMRRHVAGELRTFSIGFEHEQYNELPFAREVAEQYETLHEEFVVRADAAAALPKLVWHFDEPFGDMAALPTYYLSEMTRRHVTVALNGDGGDESFAGYNRYAGWFPSYRLWKKTPALFRRYSFGPLVKALSALCPERWFLAKLDFINTTSLADPAFAYCQMLVLFREWLRERLYTPEFAAGTVSDESLVWMENHYGAANLSTPIDRMLNTDVNTYLAEVLLPKVDRTTMAFGLEGRSPLLDQELMAYAASLPASIKFPDAKQKNLLKKVAEPLLPQSLLTRKKQGFATPMNSWLRNGLHGLARELLLSDRAVERGFFKRSALEKIFSEEESGRWNHGHRIWMLMFLEMWCRTFLDRQDIRSGPLDM